MAKLRRQVRRTKEILSANSAAPMSVEELHAGKDFQSSIKREVFEAMAEDFWQRAAVSAADCAASLKQDSSFNSKRAMNNWIQCREPAPQRSASWRCRLTLHAALQD
eukprot:GHRR01037062.1.p1 GENE.GHRR01037062.1~~GHRR01037062.1.p1  ORF type:complete len:107 (+),score=29.83 GHRR01037062.1:412-732(+)